MNLRSPLRDEKKDVIESGALRLTWGSGVGAVIVSLGAAINPVFESVFGDTATPNIKAAILIAAIGAWSLIATGDLLARAYATANTGPQIASAPAGMNVTLTKGVDESGYIVAAIRTPTSGSDEVELLLVKAGKEPSWVRASEVRIA